VQADEIAEAQLRHQLYADAATAFQALGTLLGADDWFFGADRPGVFDAEVFAYTWLVLDAELGWRSSELRESLSGVENLVAHRERLYQRCWPQ
jgi:metaxin